MKFSRWFTVNIVAVGMFLICGVGPATSAESPHWLSSTLVRVQSDSDPYFDPFDLSTVPAPVAKIPSTGLKTELEPETAAILPMPSIPQPLVKTDSISTESISIESVSRGAISTGSISTESVSRGAFAFAVSIQPLGPKPLAIPRPAESPVLVSGIRAQPLAASSMIYSTPPVSAAPVVFTAQSVTASPVATGVQSQPLVKTESIGPESFGRGAFPFAVSIQPIGPKPLAIPDSVKSPVLVPGISAPTLAASPVIFSTPLVTATPVILSSPPLAASPVILSTPPLAAAPVIFSTQPVAAGPLVASIQPMMAGPLITSTPLATTPQYVSSEQSVSMVPLTSSSRQPYRPAVRSPYRPAGRGTL